MYKGRLKKWGIAKYVKEHEVKAILRIASERDADGKKTLVLKNNKTVEIERYLRHARRKGIQDIGQSAPDTPACISCTTPPPEHMPRSYGDDNHMLSEQSDPSQNISATSISLFWTPTSPENQNENVEEVDSEWSGACTPLSDEGESQMTLHNMPSNFFDPKNICRSLLPPKALSVPEQLFYNIKAYYASSFEDGAWALRDENSCTLYSLSGLVDHDPRNEFLGYCYMAVNLRRRGLFVKFRKVLSKAFSIVQDILQASHPRTLDRLFESFLYLIHNEQLDVAILLRNYIHDLTAKLPSSQPSSGRVFQLIGILDDESLEQTITTSWQCNNDALDDCLGPFNDLGLLARLNHIQNVHGAINPLEEERLLRRLLEDCERLSDKSVTQVSTIMFSLGQSMLAQARYSDAENLGLGILSRARNEPRINLNGRVDAFVLTATGQYHQNKQDLAIKNIRDAICMLVNEYGKIGPLGTQYMNTLESWLREWGRGKEADGLKVAVDLVVGLDEVDME